MKISKYFALIFGLLGILMAAVTVGVSFASIDADPVLLTPPESAHTQVTQMMDAFCAGDYTRAQQAMYGTIELGVDRDASDEIGKLVWEAFEASISYSLVGECYATDSGLSQNIHIQTMDISSVTDYIKENAKTVLEERVLSAEDLDAVYEDDDQYRDEFVDGVLLDVAREAIANHAKTVETELTLNLTWADGQWWVVSNEALLHAVSGGVI